MSLVCVDDPENSNFISFDLRRPWSHFCAQASIKFRRWEPFSSLQVFWLSDLNHWPPCCATKLPSGDDLSGHVIIVSRKQEHLLERWIIVKNIYEGDFAPYWTFKRERAHGEMSNYKMQDPKSGTKRGLQSTRHRGARLDSPCCYGLWHVSQYCFAVRPLTCDYLQWLNSVFKGVKLCNTTNGYSEAFPRN